MMHAMAQWNWGGLVFVGGMFARVALSGWATERLRRWAERPEDPVANVRCVKHHLMNSIDKQIEQMPRWNFHPIFSDDELRVMRSATERKQ